MLTEKKEYLKRYLLQEAKILRYKQMAQMDKQLEKFYTEKIIASQKLRKEIENKINVIDNELLVELLYQKYILGKTLDEISIILNYSKRHIERLHVKALEKIDI